MSRKTFTDSGRGRRSISSGPGFRLLDGGAAERPNGIWYPKSRDGKRILVGEEKWTERALGARQTRRLLDGLAVKRLPPIPDVASKEIRRALFVPEARAPGSDRELSVVTAADVVG